MEHFPFLYILEEKERRERRETYGKGARRKETNPGFIATTPCLSVAA